MANLIRLESFTVGGIMTSTDDILFSYLFEIGERWISDRRVGY